MPSTTETYKNSMAISSTNIHLLSNPWCQLLNFQELKLSFGLSKISISLELASSVISKLRYTLIFVECPLAQIVLCSFCLSFYVCFRYSSNWFENAYFRSRKKKIRQVLYQNRKLWLELVTWNSIMIQ